MKWILLMAVVAVPWLKGLTAPFIYDDIGMLAENSFLEEPSNIGEVLTGRTLGDPQVINGRRPVVLATYFMDRALYGLQPAGWRVTSLLLHLGCTALLAGLVWRLTRKEYLAMATGLIFGLHPVLSEAVHAPGFRADVLCLLFMLGAVHLLMGPERPNRFRWAAAAVCTALALLSKETAVAFPLLLAALMGLYPDAFVLTRRERAGALAGNAALAGGFFVLWVLLPAALQGAGGSWNGESLRFPENLWSMPALWTRTLRLLAVPWPLNVTPQFQPVGSPLSAAFLAGTGFLALCVWGAWRARRQWPAISLGLVWMLVFFLPVSNLFPLLHPVADRYLVPIVPGFALLVAWLVSMQSRPARSWGLAAIAAIYALLLWMRLSQWQSPERLWTAAYFQNSKSATAATWLGLLRSEAGDPDGARAFYEEAVKSNPQAAAAWLNWGILEGKAGNWAESERLIRQAIDVRPEKASGWRNLAVCLRGQGRNAEADAVEQRAEELEPDQGRANP